MWNDDKVKPPLWTSGGAVSVAGWTAAVSESARRQVLSACCRLRRIRGVGEMTLETDFFPAGDR